jgi:hypothetical protein
VSSPCVFHRCSLSSAGVISRKRHDLRPGRTCVTQNQLCRRCIGHWQSRHNRAIGETAPPAAVGALAPLPSHGAPIDRSRRQRIMRVSAGCLPRRVPRSRVRRSGLRRRLPFPMVDSGLLFLRPKDRDFHTPQRRPRSGTDCTWRCGRPAAPFCTGDVQPRPFDSLKCGRLQGLI